MIMHVTIAHLLEYPQHLDAVAQMIHREFWVDVENGMSVEDLSAHLHTATDTKQIPLCLIARVDGRLVGTVNLIENDDTKRTLLKPWLAAMVVQAEFRGQGIGSMLVKALLAEARAMQLSTLYFGTDGPGFYTRLGAVEHEFVRDNFSIMRFELA
jgi:predicted N-acetyltransferase YhbS